MTCCFMKLDSSNALKWMIIVIIILTVFAIFIGVNVAQNNCKFKCPKGQTLIKKNKISITCTNSTQIYKNHLKFKNKDSPDKPTQVIPTLKLYFHCYTIHILIPLFIVWGSTLCIWFIIAPVGELICNKFPHEDYSSVQYAPINPI